MPILPRYVRFNLVGLVGAAVQLTTFAALNHFFPRHYRLTSTAALELTLLHNLAWHRRYTWPDRTHSHPKTHLAQATRFHLTNGLTSLCSTLALMPFLVQRAHLPAVAAIAATIVLCSLINFTLSDRWAFRSRLGKQPLPALPVQHLFGFLLCCGLFCNATCSSQAQQAATPLPQEPPAAQPSVLHLQLSPNRLLRMQPSESRRVPHT